MLKFAVILSGLFSIGVSACQNPPVISEQDVNAWKAKILDSREENRDSFVLDIAFPTSFKGYPLTEIRLFKGEGIAQNEFIFLLDSSNSSSVRALVGKEAIDELVLVVNYSNCGYKFEYELVEYQVDGL